MIGQDWLAGQFEHNREHLQAVAYSMLGTVREAQDAVQEAWLRLGAVTRVPSATCAAG
jgi:RNA polymerase sigma-70 factor, ECF subfamily